MKWIRLWCERLLSPRSDTWQELGEAWEAYSKLMCVAGVCERHGKIAVPGTSVGYTDEQLAGMCRMPMERFTAQLATLIRLNKVKRLPGNELDMLGWAEFQTAYDKVTAKGYRQRLRPKVTLQMTEDRSKEEQRSEKKSEPSAIAVGLARLLAEKNPYIKKQAEAGLRTWAFEIDRCLRLDLNGDGKPRWTAETLGKAIEAVCASSKLSGNDNKAQYARSPKQLRADWFYAWWTARQPVRSKYD